MSGFAYYATIDCETCDEEMEYGLCVETNTVRKGMISFPSISVHSLEQTRFDCENCGGVTYLGDIETYHEEGEIPEECGRCGAREDECDCEYEEEDEEDD